VVPFRGNPAGSIRFSEDIDLDVGKDVAGAMQRAIPAARTHVQARDVFDLFVLGDGTLRGIDTGFLRRWLDDATLRNARSRALEISHAEYSDTVLAYLDPAQREQLQDEDTWIARQLFVGDLIDRILAVPPETIT
jgi:predicted nucleotidyltransferase component of viral defense system